MSVCANAEVLAVEWDLALPKGQTAPFSGVLVPEDSYRFYQTDANVYKGCEERLRASVGLCEPNEPWISARQLMFFFFGATAGFLAAQKMSEP